MLYREPLPPVETLKFSAEDEKAIQRTKRRIQVLKSHGILLSIPRTVTMEGEEW